MSVSGIDLSVHPPKGPLSSVIRLSFVVEGNNPESFSCFGIEYIRQIQWFFKGIAFPVLIPYDG